MFELASKYTEAEALGGGVVIGVIIVGALILAFVLGARHYEWEPSPLASTRQTPPDSARLRPTPPDAAIPRGTGSKSV
ncbi:hypothetical protein [Streptacidiphilus cavernicola]|uniref:Uncharacterized protein n=1 Tax=Streptacidiphilus cavernicola TaxID=3342716 RepID=A0ABV6W4H3_9ACTN